MRILFIGDIIGRPGREVVGAELPRLREILGLDFVIGSVKRKYERLAPDHPALVCLNDCLKLEGFEVIMRVQEFCST